MLLVVSISRLFLFLLFFFCFVVVGFCFLRLAHTQLSISIRSRFYLSCCFSIFLFLSFFILSHLPFSSSPLSDAICAFCQSSRGLFLSSTVPLMLSLSSHHPSTLLSLSLPHIYSVTHRRHLSTSLLTFVRRRSLRPPPLSPQGGARRVGPVAVMQQRENRK